MANATTLSQIKRESLKIEGALIWANVWRSNLIIWLLMKGILYFGSKIEQKLNISKKY